MLERFSHAIQIVSGLVLIAGVILVVLQIRQTERLTQAQLAEAYFNKVIAQAAAAAGENPMAAYARMCDPTEPLSLEDALVIHNLFLQRLNLALSSIVVADVSGSDAPSERTTALFVANLNLVIATQYGREWLSEFELAPNLRKAVETSPYYQSSCEDIGGMVTRLLEVDQNVRGQSAGA